MFKVCFLTFGDFNIASSRLRAFWVAEYLEGSVVVTADELRGGRPIPEAEVYVWQKIVDVNEVKRQKERGALVFWDTCEPHWWWEPNKCREVTNAVDAVVCSNAELADDYYHWRGEEAYYIRDRFDLAHFHTRKTHKERTFANRLIWYGYSQNRFGLMGALAVLERLYANDAKISLTIMDDDCNPNNLPVANFPVYFSQWRLDNEVAVTADHDLAILPDYPGAWGKVKSKNRKIFANLCGLPAVTGDDWGELYNLCFNSAERMRAADEAYKNAVENYNVKQSAKEWESIIKEYEP
jgi:hypothetical protein